ncbi:hypothetical protein RAMLITH_07000 [Ramlibacter sp. RBP-2]|uniref:Uncharacterized protein n=1 Tax=Ramlibacter lithotrophicus TaxID=2606681 RepID=A0A7X6DEA3_9BURK|nr:hypothetical protein [Ramlibacter lithotrophicus]NKE65566.1 hypothetical protein [Ramlibacter lithotrophicus]
MTHHFVRRTGAAILSLSAAALLSACGGGGSAVVELPARRDSIAALPTVISAEMLLQWAESAHPRYFQPPGQPTQSAATYSFRHYPYTGNFLAVAGEDVFLLGASTGFAPQRVGSLADYQCDVLPSVCWSGAVPRAIPYVQGVYGAAWPSKAYVIRDAQAWAAAWAERQNFVWPEPALPAVDFTRYAVVGGGDGWATCSQIEVKLILRVGTDYRVFWGDVARDPLLACPAVLSPRLAFVLMEQPVGNVEFVRITPTPRP